MHKVLVLPIGQICEFADNMLCMMPNVECGTVAIKVAADYSLLGTRLDTDLFTAKRIARGVETTYLDLEIFNGVVSELTHQVNDLLTSYCTPNEIKNALETKISNDSLLIKCKEE